MDSMILAASPELYAAVMAMEGHTDALARFAHDVADDVVRQYCLNSPCRRWAIAWLSKEDRTYEGIEAEEPRTRQCRTPGAEYALLCAKEVVGAWRQDARFTPGHVLEVVYHANCAHAEAAIATAQSLYLADLRQIAP